jgi:nicotinate-nucleotide adenylyltransferase
LKQKLGLLGGTFNPIHNGHLFLALEARYRCALDRVVFMPNRIPPHKRLPQETAGIRYAMLESVVKDVEEFELSRLELDRTGRSYTIDTVEELSSENELVFICGCDAFNAPWFRLEEVVENLHTLLIANRAGSKFELPTQLASLPDRLRHKITMMPFPDISISSSDIRRRIQDGRPFRFLIPEPVYRIITKSGLYREA